MYNLVDMIGRTVQISHYRCVLRFVEASGIMVQNIAVNKNDEEILESPEFYPWHTITHPLMFRAIYNPQEKTRYATR